MSYLDLVEEHGIEAEINQFEKIMVLAARAKDIYDGRQCQLFNLDHRKPTAQAQYEMNAGFLEIEITDIDEEANLQEFDEEE